MLVLTRRENEAICLDGLDVTFRILGIRGGRVQIGIDAPPHIVVSRPDSQWQGRVQREAGTAELVRGLAVR